MAAKKKKSKGKKGKAKGKKKAPAAALSLGLGSPPQADEFGIQTTGRMIVTFMNPSSAGVKAGLKTMKAKAGVARVSHAKDFGAAFSMAEAQTADALVLEKLGMAVMSGDPDQMAAMSVASAAGTENMVVEPEYMNYPVQLTGPEPIAASPGGLSGGFPPEAYLRGWRDAIDRLLASLGGDGGEAAAVADVGAASHVFQDTATATWGLQATRVLASPRSGAGIKVAVLDTGFDLNHPDYAGRSIQSASFISGESVQDGHGHGTHCIGTACGPRNPGIGRRYGVAFGARIFAGKVLSNGGSGGDASILAGINWALQNGCQVISMSLGRRVRPGEAPQTNYEMAGSRALQQGTLIVAAAGNDSMRPHITIPVSSPANASSIVAVAALDRFLRVASFSNQGINPSGGEINFAGPGVDVHSSWPLPTRLRSISGTSMATPHVAGVAALVAEESTAFRGVPLYVELTRRVRRLPVIPDVGWGLIQA